MYNDMVPNLTDMFIRGAATLPLSAHVKQLLEQIKAVTDAQRANPSATRAPGEIVAPSVAGGKPAAGTGGAAATGAAATAAGGSAAPAAAGGSAASKPKS